MPDPLLDRTRRQLFRDCAIGMGSLALSSLLAGAGRVPGPEADPMAARKPHFAPKAKRIIYLFMNGAPSQLDLLDHKSPNSTSWTARTAPRSS